MAKQKKTKALKAYTWDREAISDGELKKIANELVTFIAASDASKGDLLQVWSDNEDSYYCSGSQSSVSIIEGESSREWPVWQSKEDRIEGDVVRQLTTIYPMVQCIDESTEGKPTDDIATALTVLADLSKFSTRHIRALVFDSLNTNNSFCRIKPKVSDDDGTVTGFDVAVVKPRDMVVYPAEVDEVTEARCVGHNFNLMAFEVEEQIRDGFYIDPFPEKPFGKKVYGGDQYKDETGDNSQNTENESHTEPATTEDQNVSLYEVLFRRKMDGSDEYRWYIGTLWRTASKMLDLQPYAFKTRDGSYVEYPEPWYVKYYVKQSRDRIWSPWAPATPIRALQTDISMLKEMAIQGTAFAAMPVVVTSGGSLEGKSYRLKPGEILSLPQGVVAQRIDTSFNPGLIEPMLEAMDGMCDASTGVSRLGTSENVPSSTTATAAAGFLQAQSEAKSDYASAIAEGVEQTWRIFFWIFQTHADTIIAANKKRLPSQLSVEIVRGLSLRFEATGTSGASSPQTFIQKLMFLLQMTAGDPAYDKNAIINLIIQNLDLPVQQSALMVKEFRMHPQVMALLQMHGYTPEEIFDGIHQQMQQQQIAQQAQLAMPQQAGPDGVPINQNPNAQTPVMQPGNAPNNVQQPGMEVPGLVPGGPPSGGAPQFGGPSGP